jgi:hypothetical protein
MEISIYNALAGVPFCLEASAASIYLGTGDIGLTNWINSFFSMCVCCFFATICYSVSIMEYIYWEYSRCH